MRRLLRENGLSIVLFSLFIVFWIGQSITGHREYNNEQAEHGQPERLSTLQYAGTARFWFESLQNWQSEFLALVAMVVLSIFLRQRGSPES
ncbi:MAG TPA: DUF6766 family protein, partial [Gemmatimonadales bacterium]|nr:DUF6766 family protein [Gemmatimonadales bacterium]